MQTAVPLVGGILVAHEEVMRLADMRRLHPRYKTMLRSVNQRKLYLLPSLRPLRIHHFLRRAFAYRFEKGATRQDITLTSGPILAHLQVHATSAPCLL